MEQGKKTERHPPQRFALRCGCHCKLTAGVKSLRSLETTFEFTRAKSIYGPGVRDCSLQQREFRDGGRSYSASVSWYIFYRRSDRLEACAINTQRGFKNGKKMTNCLNSFSQLSKKVPKLYEKNVWNGGSAANSNRAFFFAKLMSGPQEKGHNTALTCRRVVFF